MAGRRGGTPEDQEDEAGGEASLEDAGAEEDGASLEGGGGASVTETEQEAVLFPSAVVMVMTALPALWRVTFPEASTEATPLSLLCQLTLWLVALLGAMDQVRV